MAVPVILGVLSGATGLSLTGWALVRRKRAHAASPVAPGDAALPPGAPSQGNSGLLGGVKDFLGGDPTKLGLLISDAAGDVAEFLGAGKGKADLVRVGGPGMLLPVVVDLGTRKALDALGVKDAGTQKTAGQLATAGAVGGLGGLALVGSVKGADALLGAVSPGAQAAVHDVFRPFDPTNPNSAAGKVVSSIANMFGIGGGKDPAAQARDDQVFLLAQQNIATGTAQPVSAQDYLRALAQAEKQLPSTTPLPATPPPKVPTVNTGVVTAKPKWPGPQPYSALTPALKAIFDPA